MTVELGADPGQTVTIPIAVTHNGGASTDDYSGVPASVTFTSGDRSETFTVTATDDSVDDDGESLTLRFGTLPNGVSAGSPALSMVSLQDNDVPEVTVSYEQATYTVSENSSVTVKVILSADPERTVTVPITKTNQAGAANADYSGVPGSLTFQQRRNREIILLCSATQDTDDDDGESVKLAFGALPTGVSAGTTSEATVSITDDDLPAVTVKYGAATYTAIEGGSAVTVTVELGADPERTVTIPIAVTHNGGASTDDYSDVPASVTFTSGDRSETFTVTATDDNLDDDGESLTLRFGTLPNGVSAGNPTTATVDLLDDDVPQVSVSFSASNYAAVEGGSPVTVTVELDADAERAVTIPFNVTHNGGASTDDYSGVPASVTFTSGDRSETFTVTATDDTVDDDGESLTLAFHTLPKGVSVGSRVGATISLLDNDSKQVKMSNKPTSTVPTPKSDGLTMVSVSFNMELYWASEGGNPASITMELDADPGRRVTIPLNVTFVNGASLDDYSGVPASVTFDSGEVSKTFILTAVDDTEDDDEECLILTFGAFPNGISAGSVDTATSYLLDNDVPQVSVLYGAATYTATEGGRSAMVTVELDADPKRVVTIPISVKHNGSANSADYSGVPSSLTFSSGNRSETFTVTATDDSEDDDDESVVLSFGTLPAGMSAGSLATTTVNLVDNNAILMLITASLNTRTYLAAQSNNSATVTVELDVNPVGTMSVPTNITRKRVENGGD